MSLSRVVMAHAVKDSCVISLLHQMKLSNHFHIPVSFTFKKIQHFICCNSQYRILHFMQFHYMCKCRKSFMYCFIDLCLLCNLQLDRDDSLFLEANTLAFVFSKVADSFTQLTCKCFKIVAKTYFMCVLYLFTESVMLLSELVRQAQTN